MKAGPERARVVEAGEAADLARSYRERGLDVVFTNGCFDLLHVGHVRLLAAARELGDVLFVAVNDDESVRRLKGEPRPLVPLEDRLELLAAIRSVDVVFAFAQDTPLEAIRAVRPRVLVKGADYAAEAIVGADLVESWGGRVARVPLVGGRSTSQLLRRLSGAGGGG
jgi:D-beta-D-heptose 7-phosphate kinase/D-beta-D-heptose 1-phosphate adenosyltransferase